MRRVLGREARARSRTVLAALSLALFCALAARSPAQASPPALAAVPLAALALPGGHSLPYLVSARPGEGVYGRALIAIHGYTRDATRTFAAAAEAAAKAGAAADTLIVAPIFPVPAPDAEKCHWHGVPEAQPGDALWRCGTWSDGLPALNAKVTSFGAMDALVAEIARAYPHIRIVTIAGFSAGGQFVQRYAGFADVRDTDVTLRYVVADPSEFLYFDPERPRGSAAGCHGGNRWKFGTDDLPAFLGRTATAARAAYVAADIHYLIGARDTGDGPGTAYRLLGRSCAAERQGEYRLDRAEHYAAYDAARLAHGRHPLTIVPGCAHSVLCVFPSPAARAALFGPPATKAP